MQVSWSLFFSLGVGITSTQGSDLVPGGSVACCRCYTKFDWIHYHDLSYTNACSWFSRATSWAKITGNVSLRMHFCMQGSFLNRLSLGLGSLVN